MAAQHTDRLTHEQVRENLPWYVNARLDAALLRQIETHLATCASCKREADELAVVLRAGEQRAVPGRPVDEARLAAVFSRIDAYEVTRARHGAQSSFWERVRDQVANWLPANPAIAFGAVAALVLVVALVPLRQSMQSELPNQQHVVLASGEGQDDALRIVVRFDSAPSQDALANLIESQYTGKYEVKGGTAAGGTDYVVTLLQKPDLPALSRIVGEWRQAPHVVDVQIESVPAAK
jgi:hypothetical protein